MAGVEWRASVGMTDPRGEGWSGGDLRITMVGEKTGLIKNGHFGWEPSWKGGVRALKG